MHPEGDCPAPGDESRGEKEHGRSMIANVLRSFAMNLDYARRLLGDVTDEQMTAQPAKRMNPPAWIVGHIVRSFQLIGDELGLKPWLPGHWNSLFATGSIPQTEGADYPNKTTLLDALVEGRRKLTDALGAMTDKDLDRPLPDKRFRHIFPSLGSAVLHILTVHTAVHVGQLSAWRRAMGLPPVDDPL